MKASAASKKLNRMTVADYIIYLVLGICAFTCIVPFWYVIMSSFSRTDGFIIRDFTLEAYQYIFSTHTLPRSLMVSIVTTVIGTIVKLLFTSSMAYCLSEHEMPGRKLILNMVIFTMLFEGGMIPTFFVVKATGLMNSIWAMIIPGLISPFNLIVMKNFYENIPYTLRESARIDGCPEILLMFRIIMPLSLPALATFGLFYAVGLWNTYMSALLYIQKSEMWPIQVLLRRIVYVSSAMGDSQNMDTAVTQISQTIKVAVILVATVPILCVYPFLQKHFAKGIMVGSVKG